MFLSLLIINIIFLLSFRSPARPDLVESDPTLGISPPHSLRNTPLSPEQPLFGQDPPEHYDIDNASSIAPSDIDIVYHYKGYRDGNRHRYSGGGKSLSKRRQNQLKNTPLARLSPSSEMSHPRILTLGDLSGKPLPPSLLTEQSEPSLNSPVSHVSSSVSQTRGLTSENVARFNQGESTPKSSLLNTLDMLSVGSGSRQHKYNSSTTPLDVASSSSSEVDDDSFTCSEFEYDSHHGDESRVKESHSNEGAMIFNKLVLDPQDEDGGGGDMEEEEKSWETLLNWMPDYRTFSGVFRDIAELPNANSANDEIDLCRPSPLGDHRTEEQYI